MDSCTLWCRYCSLAFARQLLSLYQILDVSHSQKLLLIRLTNLWKRGQNRQQIQRVNAYNFGGSVPNLTKLYQRMWLVAEVIT